MILHQFLIHKLQNLGGGEVYHHIKTAKFRGWEGRGVNHHITKVL